MDLERSTRRSTRAVGLAPLAQPNAQKLPIDSSAKGRAVRNANASRATIPIEQQAAEKENVHDWEAVSQATPSESKKRRDVTKASKGNVIFEFICAVYLPEASVAGTSW